MNFSEFYHTFEIKYLVLEIKPCELGSRIRDVEAFRYKTQIKINAIAIITQGICNKFIEVNFCVGWPNCLLIEGLNICQILMQEAKTCKFR